MIKDQIRHILRKHPETKFSRGMFMWEWCREYLGISIGLSKSQFLEFWTQEAGLERALREVIKEPEFKLEPKADSKRYERAAAFKKWAKKPEQARFNKAFNYE